MITRIRIEGENENKVALIDELISKGNEMMRLASAGSGHINWKITDDVISYDRNRDVHKGRMVFTKQ